MTLQALHTNIFQLVLDFLERSPKDIYALRNTCKKGKHEIDILLNKRWQVLLKNTPAGPVDIKGAIEVLDKQTDKKILEKFRALADQFSQKGALAEKKIPFMPFQFTRLQKEVEVAQATALVKIWSDISIEIQELPLFGINEGTDKAAKNIRDWLNDSKNISFLKGHWDGCWTLAQFDLKILPHEIAKFPIKELILKGNQLKTLPPEIGNLKELRVLNLCSNSLEYLPDSIGELSNLEKIDLSNNYLSQLPATIGKLTNLQELNLTNNEFEELPCTITGLQKLKTLILDENLFDTWPEEIRQLKNLEKVELINNPLMFVPDEILSSQDPLIVRCEAMTHFKQELAYSAQSPLAQFYQMIIHKKPEAEIQARFFQLNDEVKNKIYQMVAKDLGNPQTQNDVQWGKQHVFDKMLAFCRAVKKGILLKFKQYRGPFCDNIFKLTGKEQKEYGHYKTYENFTLVIDAMELFPVDSTKTH
jgi:hypothetical protein